MTHTPAAAVRIAACVAAVVLTRCAHQSAPGGGPRDLAPPGVASTAPSAESVNVEPASRISLEFSEWVSPRLAERSVTVFPPPAEGYDIAVKGRTLTVKPLPTLAESTTYHVEVTAALQDLHGNSIGTPYHLVFATGPKLDSGKVSGCVIDPAKRVLQPKVALYGSGDTVSDTVIFGTPRYVTQTDSGGRFTLEHIRPDTYALIAFMDGNNDNRFQPMTERAYAPVSRQVVVGDSATPHVLYPVRCDTSWTRIASLVPLSGTVIAGRWNRLPAWYADTDPAPPLHIVPLDTGVAAPRVARYSRLGESPSFALLLSEPLQVAPYALVYDMGPVMDVPDTVSLSDTLRFNGVTTIDTVPPSLTSRREVATRDLGVRFAMVWSEPVRMQPAEAVLADSLGDSVLLVIDTCYAETLLCRPTRRLLPGRAYTASIPCEHVADLAGNHPADTTGACTLSVTVTTVHGDSLCLSFTGGLPCPETVPGRFWVYTPVGSRAVWYAPDSSGRFRFDSLPGSHGLLAWFIDHDSDTAHDEGTLIPWSPPEPYVPFYDTVEARPRWDIEDIEVPSCDPCERGQMVTPDVQEAPQSPGVGTSGKSRRGREATVPSRSQRER
jgi:hypothetical protein